VGDSSPDTISRESSTRLVIADLLAVKIVPIFAIKSHDGAGMSSISSVGKIVERVVCPFVGDAVCGFVTSISSSFGDVGLFVIMTDSKGGFVGSNDSIGSFISIGDGVGFCEGEREIGFNVAPCDDGDCVGFCVKREVGACDDSAIGDFVEIEVGLSVWIDIVRAAGLIVVFFACEGGFVVGGAEIACFVGSGGIVGITVGGSVSFAGGLHDVNAKHVIFLSGHSSSWPEVHG